MTTKQMSNTYKHKNYFKWKRKGYEDEPPLNCKFWKSPRESKCSKYIIQTLGHRRRRAAERDLFQKIKTKDVFFGAGFLDYDCPEYYDWGGTLEDFDYEKYLHKAWSDVWDYY